MTREEAKEFLTNISYKLGNMSVEYLSEKDGEKMREAIETLEQEPQTFKWCTDCREYDQEKHCCHRWSKVIRNTVEEMKQEYIERDVLDNIYADIQRLRGCSCSSSDGIIDDVEDILDKYKAETEDKA